MSLPAPRPDLCQLGGRALVGVLDSLLALPVGGVTRIPGAAGGPDCRGVVSTVPLLGETVSGDVQLQLSNLFIEHAAGVLLGPDHAAPTGETVILDLAGELCNMVAGRVAANLGQEGFPCSLGIPHVVRGAPSRRGPEPDEHCGRTDWSCLGHRITLEIHCRYLLP